jgi:hypothetical protein
MQTGVAGKTYGTVAAEQRSAMSGLDFVRGLVEGTLPLNTIARTLGYDDTERRAAQSGRHRAWRLRGDAS